MRPHILKFGGIGAYAGEVEIDFDDLSKQGLYLIVGPTGAGKTTIFDAMTFALYGKTASDRESMFVSDHDGRVNPYVDFTFSHQGRRFVVHREPPKEKGKQSPTNKQWFREIDESGNEIRTMTGVEATNNSVKDLLGLDASQFMKVVLLPQGKFQEFLMAKSTDRKPLLQKIFGTGLYASIAIKLKEAAADLEREAERAKQALENEQGTVRSVVESLDEDVQAGLPDPDQNLQMLIEELEKVHQSLKESSDDAGARLKAAVGVEATAKTEVERFDAHVQLQELEPLQQQESEAAKVAAESIKAHERAGRVKTASDSDVVAQRDAEANQAQVTTSRANLTKIVKGLAIPPDATSTLIGSLDSASPTSLAGEIDKISRKVNEVLSANRDLVTARSDEKWAEGEIIRREKEVKGLEADKTKTTKALAAAKKKQKESNDAAKNLPVLQGQIDKIDSLIEMADVEGAQKFLVEVDEKLRTAEKAFAVAGDKLEQARTNRTMHLAGELAASLAKGDECPVCGSVEHPKKAKKTSDVDVDKLEKARDKAQGVKLSAEADLRAAQKAVEVAQENKAKLPTAAEEKKLRNELAKTSELAQLLEEREEEVETLEGALEDLGGSLSTLSEEIAGFKSSLNEARKKITRFEPEASVLGPLEPVEKAEGILETAKSFVSELESAVEEATTAAAHALATKKTLTDVLAAEGFTNVESAIAAILPEAELTELREVGERVALRAERIATLKGIVGSEPAPKDRPDVDGLALAREEARVAYESASASAATVLAAIRQLISARDNIERLGPQVATKVEQADRAVALAKIINTGTGAGNDRQLALEEWVQRTLFEEVCDVASEQLLMLSNNRYLLSLDAEDARVKNRAGGLELYVIDSHNGKRRSVQTLSGGEQFLTSLALALALAEVVERHAGGMELSALFIDEGFGSLDGDTLDAAIDVLMKLHDTGRTVGVITHVEAMQQQLPIGIRISKSNKGSTLEVLASA
jgi:exonuclease SbcC